MRLPNIVILKTIVKKMTIYVWYANLLLLFISSIWLYFFLEKYFIGLQDDFKFMRENVSNVSDVRLDEIKFKEVYDTFQKKLDSSENSPQNIRSLF